MSSVQPIRALVIDDSAFSRQAIARMLRPHPFVDKAARATQHLLDLSTIHGW